MNAEWSGTTRIRPVESNDIDPGIELVRRVFDELVAPDLGPGGAATFAAWADPAAFRKRLGEGHRGLVAIRDHRIVGLLEWMPPDHLAMLFVDPAVQGEGIGRRLFAEALSQVRSDRENLTAVTVHASRHALPFYRGMGFHETGPEQERNGILYTPMRLEIGEGRMNEGAPRSALPEEIERYYAEFAEEDRLDTGPFRLERERTREVLLRFLPTPPARILDVGGAAGAHALWLAGRGYEVHLIDPVARLVEEARRRSHASPDPIRTCRSGDARDLPFDDGSADTVLLLGPLYHLTRSAQRARALREARRVLRPGGMLFAAAISRYASALDGISRDLLSDPAFEAIARQDLETGLHVNETGNPEYFTTAYFHRPEDLREEVASAGFDCRAVIGLEGPGWMLADFEQRWKDPRKREDMLRLARALESEPSIIGLSAHMLAVGVKK